MCTLEINSIELLVAGFIFELLITKVEGDVDEYCKDSYWFHVRFLCLVVILEDNLVRLIILEKGEYVSERIGQERIMIIILMIPNCISIKHKIIVTNWNYSIGKMRLIFTHKKYHINLQQRTALMLQVKFRIFGIGDFAYKFEKSKKEQLKNI